MDVDSEVGDASCGGSSQSKEAEEFSNVEVGSKVVAGADTDNVERTNTEKREGDGVNNPEPSVGSRGEGGSKAKEKAKVNSGGEDSQEDHAAVPELINLMPDSDDDSDEGSDKASSEKVTFKKRKTSHSLRNSLRRRGGQDESTSSDEEVPEVEPMAIASSPLQMPDLTSGEEGEASRTTAAAPPRSSSRGSNSRTRQVPQLTSSEGEDDQRKERVRARRIVRADDLVTLEGEQGGQRSSSSSSSSDTDEDGTPSATFISEKAREVIFKPISASKHSVLSDLASRQMGLKMKPSFTARRCGSSDLVKRFKLAAKLSGHEGCVNCLNFNQAGTKIASGSDDLNIIVWEWERGRKMLQFNSGHKANVFQSKFLPGDLLITSCSRDGQVRLAELSVTGSLRSTKKLAQHRGPAHKMTLLPDSPYIVLSAGEDGQVLSIDIREPKPDKILLLRNEKDKKVPIYSIHSSPTNSHLFCTSGRDQFIRVFDRRYLGLEARGGGQVYRHCPTDLRDSDSFKAYITCAVFSGDGQEVLGSYNDEDIYLFRTDDPEGSDFTHRYQGHRNSATVKGVNFYGPDSQFVISGSDCGNIFLWDKQTEGIVKLMPGDDNGVVNVLEPHPSLPILATSGLDDEVKLWMPNQSTEGPGHCWQREQKEYMQKTVQRNLQDRETQRNSEPDPLDGQMLWVLWRHIRRAERRRREAAAARGEEEAGSGEESEEEDDDSDGEEGPRGRMCTQS